MQYQQEWLDNLKANNKQYSLSKKELIKLNRFAYNISEIKTPHFKVNIGNQTKQIYQSEYSTEGFKVALT